MLLDTSGLLCLHDRVEAFHDLAVSSFRTATVRVTHNLILAEFVPLAQVRKLPRQAALTFVADLLENPKIDIFWVDDALHRAAMNLLNARLDKTYSLCDAVSMLLMKQRGLMDALSTDRHFEQEGFRRLLKAN